MPSPPRGRRMQPKPSSETLSPAIVRRVIGPVARGFASAPSAGGVAGSCARRRAKGASAASTAADLRNSRRVMFMVEGLKGLKS